MPGGPQTGWAAKDDLELLTFHPAAPESWGLRVFTHPTSVYGGAEELSQGFPAC